jgi:hypothetical protein
MSDAVVVSAVDLGTWGGERIDEKDTQSHVSLNHPSVPATFDAKPDHKSIAALPLESKPVRFC